MTPTIRRTVTGSRTATAALAAVGLALTLTACGSSDGGIAQGQASGGAAQGEADDVEAALEEGGDLLVWAWEPTLEQVVEDFEAKYPNVNVELANVGTGNDHYVALQNALAAGSGAPDVAQVEYYALGQFTITESLADLSPYGAQDLDGTFSPGPWGAVSQGGGVYGLPMDSGPMAMFYNAEVFERLGVEVPTTWEQYVEAARALHAADPNVYISSDGNDAGFATSIMWQAGGKPFTVDGTDVAVDLTGDEGAAKYAQTWQQLIDEGLVSDIQGWSDEWFQALGNGTLATLTTGAWMPANLESGSPEGAGKWRVAPMPQWEDGAAQTAENGGSSIAVTEASENKALAYGFLEYATADEGVQTRLEGGAFPATTADLESEEFKNKEFPYFGGQKANEVLSESAANVVEGWQYLPFQVYANSVFPDTAGQAFIGSGSLADGLKAWQEDSVAYAEEQGFTIK